MYIQILIHSSEHSLFNKFITTELLDFFDDKQSSNMYLVLTCSWHQKNESTNSPIHEFKVLHKCQRAFLNPLFKDLLFIIHYFKKHSKSSFFILKASKDILQLFKFVNWWIRSFVFWCYEQATRLLRSMIKYVYLWRMYDLAIFFTENS